MYDFKEQDAYNFAQHVGIKAKRVGNNLHFVRCPYCNGRDKDTFAINLQTGQFNCFRASCGAKGNMITLSKDFNFDIGIATEYYTPKKKYKKLPNTKPIVRDKAISYLKSRGISEETVKKYKITVRKDNENVLVFPFYDENNILQFIKYRNMTYQKGSKYSKEWCEKDCKPILFGMQECSTEKADTLIVTEGQIDSLSVAESGIPNAVSVPTGAKGFTWIPYCWDFLNKYKTVIVFGDYENGHITLLDELNERLDSTVKHVRFKDYKGCKDANEILKKFGKDAIIKAIKNAIIVDNKHITPLVQVKRKNYSDISGFKSFITPLDKLIGKFYLGTLTVISGERGFGKSTFASQLGIRAIEQGFTTFFYSGELNDWQFQNWMELNMAGADNINAMTNESGYKHYSIDRNIEYDIAKWYGDKIYLYDNSSVTDDGESLLKTIEIAIKQYCCNVIFIDNLMTALSDDLGNDFYRQQGNFVKKLKEYATRFEVCIFLIAHPKKRNTDNWENDDISGSSNITNLADMVLTYTRTKKDEIGDRKLLVLKNRISGRCEFNGIPLFFQESSKRISEKDMCFNWSYGWDNNFRDVPEYVEIPFKEK